MFGQFPFAGASAGVPAGASVVPEFDVDWSVDELPARRVCRRRSRRGGTVIRRERKCRPAAHQGAGQGNCDGGFLDPFHGHHLLELESWCFEGSQDPECKNGARTRAVGRKIRAEVPCARRPA